MSCDKKVQPKGKGITVVDCTATIKKNVPIWPNEAKDVPCNYSCQSLPKLSSVLSYDSYYSTQSYKRLPVVPSKYDWRTGLEKPRISQTDITDCPQAASTKSLDLKNIFSASEIKSSKSDLIDSQLSKSQLFEEYRKRVDFQIVDDTTISSIENSPANIKTSELELLNNEDLDLPKNASLVSFHESQMDLSWTSLVEARNIFPRQNTSRIIYEDDLEQNLSVSVATCSTVSSAGSVEHPVPAKKRRKCNIFKCGRDSPPSPPSSSATTCHVCKHGTCDTGILACPCPPKTRSKKKSEQIINFAQIEQWGPFVRVMKTKPNVFVPNQALMRNKLDFFAMHPPLMNDERTERIIILEDSTSSTQLFSNNVPIRKSSRFRRMFNKILHGKDVQDDTPSNCS